MGFLHLLEERFHDCAKLVKSTISRLKEDGNQIRESLQAEQSKSQQLEEKNKILAQDRVILESEKIHLEQQAKIMQQNLDSRDLCEASDSSTQQTSDSEYHDTDSEVKLKSPRLQIQEMEQEHKITEALLKTHHETDSEVKLKSPRLQTQEMEQEHKITEALLKTEITLHEKQAQEHMMNTQKAEYALAAERKEIANLRQKMIEVNTHLEEIKRPVFVPSLRKERIKKMECDQACMCSEKNHQETLNMILQEKLDILHNLCQQKDNALQQKLAQEEVERCVKEIKADGPKKEIRNFKKRIQEINEMNDHTESALKTQIAIQKRKAQENWSVACALERILGLERKEMAKLSKKLSEVSAKLAGYQRRPVKASTSSADQPMQPLSNPCNNVEESEKIALAVEERNLYLRKLQAEEKKTMGLEENVQALREALKKEKFNFQIEMNSCNGKLHNMTELCQRKDQALLQKAAQIDYERCDKVLKVKEVLRSYKQRVKTMEEQHQKSELFYKAELKLANVTEEEQNLYLEELQAEQRETRELEDFEDTLLLDRIAESTPSPSTRRYTGSQPWSPLEVEGTHPARKPRRNSFSSVTLPSMTHKGARFHKCFKKP
ncbi:hypothetical protein AAFF_G00180080 [Aldrovandia affinis]|uniref:Uncharacterized protein n=1 Tax=Aldrovandia affinis TaxID=143900 RepID=A0AAD7SZ22_9TELE|nr:hypothetical protein AAFF_G00180080 [Aldrovandia affinis]